MNSETGLSTCLCNRRHAGLAPNFLGHLPRSSAKLNSQQRSMIAIAALGQFWGFGGFRRISTKVWIYA